MSWISIPVDPAEALVISRKVGSIWVFNVSKMAIWNGIWKWGLSVSFSLLNSNWYCLLLSYQDFMLTDQEWGKLLCCIVKKKKVLCRNLLLQAPHFPPMDVCVCEVWVPRYRDGRCHRKTQVGSVAKQKAPGEDAEKQTRGTLLRQL